jgi:hypothetical protein
VEKGLFLRIGPSENEGCGRKKYQVGLYVSGHEWADKI